MCIDMDLVKMESTKLNRNAEKMPNANTNDMISDGEHTLIKKAVEESKSGLEYQIDMIFPPICNFHTSVYKSINNRWG